MNKYLRFLLGGMLAVLGVSCDSLDPKYKISVHTEGAEEDNPREVIPLPLGGRKFLFKRVPEFSQRQISAFEPFDAPDGQGKGLVLQLDIAGRNALEYATRVRQGELMMTVVNGVPVDLVQTDKPVADGRFTIWRGISDETIANMDKKLPRLSQMRSSSPYMDMLASTDEEKKTMKKSAEQEAKMLKAAEKQKLGGGGWSLFKRKPPKEIPLSE
ncbi:MAG: hypothetical protein JNG86_14900 [Verrucomicrobiaceae bacterium]|nr:hypothetical protein [Verrucomicrobiaceae bacterium]